MIENIRVSMEYTPTDAIVLDFHYIEFDDDSGEKEEIINQSLNELQETSPEKNMKVAIIKQNEILKNNYMI